MPLAQPALVAASLRAGGREVPLLAGSGALAHLRPALREQGFRGALWVVADARADDLHGRALREALPNARVLRVSGDEADKTLSRVAGVWDWLVECGAERRDAVVAFGGGVVCDLAGFAAACYLRGVGLVNVPTTLLAQVDASVGGKTGVNHPRGKNLIGAFHQPLAVIADTSFLVSLPPRQVAAGLAEVAKVGMVLDADLFARLERDAVSLLAVTASDLAPVIARAIRLKAEVVERDEREAGERLLLNYGHTLGHAIEAAAGYGAVLHGEVVAVGMAAASHIARRLGILSERDAERQRALLEALRLPDRLGGRLLEAVLRHLGTDKKRIGARQRWVLATQVGRGTVRDDVPEALVREAAEAVLSL